MDRWLCCVTNSHVNVQAIVQRAFAVPAGVGVEVVSGVQCGGLVVISVILEPRIFRVSFSSVCICLIGEMADVGANNFSKLIAVPSTSHGILKQYTLHITCQC